MRKVNNVPRVPVTGYYTETLSCNSPLIDVGPVDDVMERAGLDVARGGVRSKFVQEARGRGKLVLRMEHRFLLLDEEERQRLMANLSFATKPG